MTSELRPCCDEPDIEMTVIEYSKPYAYLRCGNCGHATENLNIEIKHFPELKELWDKSLEQEG